MGTLTLVEMSFTKTAIGIMSGTSLDGLDMAYCRFEERSGSWSFRLEATKCVEYSEEWRQRLASAHLLSGLDLTRLDADFGRFIAKQVMLFHREEALMPPDLLASHGHTVFHAPSEGFTLQIGSGVHILAGTNITTVCDFRALDVALGGQGAPLVPIGDRLLFHDYEACLNLGGFSNISFQKDGARKAFDICPVNIVMNPWAEKMGRPYDQDGEFASSGRLLDNLLQGLEGLYTRQRPSLSREWVERHMLPILPADEAVEDVLRTISEHAARQIAEVLNSEVGSGRVLVTGGGAFNTFLLNRIRELTVVEVVVPEKSIVEFKEALVFALLGVLRTKEQVNTLASVTGARKDTSSGSILLAK
jgi:anhydro-N-acetylmuramic acid kinase